jgi:hypothetical protein
MDPYRPAVDTTWNPQPKRPWLRWAAIGIGALVLLAAIAWFVSSRPKATLSQAEQAKVSAEQALSSCGKGSDAAACQQLAVSLVAASAKATAACDVLSGSSKDQCVLRTAFASGDASMCSTIVDAGVRDLCARQFVQMDADNCTQLGGGETECDTERLYAAALKSGDPASCDSPDAQAKANCLEKLAGTDQDQDGLSFIEEHHYGTSDTNADTDGDGFKDGDEVSKGFNPAGPGKLPAGL